MDLVKRVAAFCQGEGLLHKGDTVVVGCSGGPDSLALLDVLGELRQTWELTLVVVYVHHGLRQAADDEIERVRCEAVRRQCQFIGKKIDVAAVAKKGHLSIETAGRNGRYDIFQEIAAAYESNAIAVAHHQDDQAETVLLHLLRGSGLHGLGGMRPRTGAIIRPFLCVTRRDIESYIAAKNLQPCHDETNDERLFLRNKLRLDVLPFLQQYNPAIVSDLNRLAVLAQGDDDVIDGEAKILYRAQRQHLDKGVALRVDWLQTLPVGLVRRVLRLAIAEVTHTEANIPFHYIETVRALVDKEKGKQFHSRYWQAYRTCDTVCIITAMTKAMPTVQAAPVAVTGPGTYVLDDYVLTLTVTTTKPTLQSGQVVFDGDSLAFPVSLRYRQPGDVLILPGGRKKLKKYLIDQKIPASLRKTMPLLAAGATVVWLCGHAVSTPYGVTAGTNHFLVGTISRRTTHA